MLSVADMVASDVATVFNHLQNTAILLNKHYYAQTAIWVKDLQQYLGFAHSKLIDLEVCVDDEISECLRLGMLAFVAATFRLPGTYTHPGFRSLSIKLERSYAAIRPSHAPLHPTLHLWLMFVCQISFGDIPEHHAWANFKSSEMGSMSWTQIRRELKRVLWIDAFHDDLGKRAFDTLTGQFDHASFYQDCNMYSD